MLNCICSQNKYTVHESSTAKKVGVSLALLAGAGALLTLGTLFLLHSKLEATRLAPLGRYMSQHPQAFKISGISSITLAILPTGSLAIYLGTSTSPNKKTSSEPEDIPTGELIPDNGTVVEKGAYPEELTPLSPILISFNRTPQLTPIYRGTNPSVYYFYANPLPPGVSISSSCNSCKISPATIEQPLYSMPAQ